MPGTCNCNNVTLLDAICDSTCRSQVPTMACDGNGNIVITDPATGSTRTVAASSFQTQGALDCSTPGASVHAMTSTSGSFGGVFGTGNALASTVLTTSNTSRRLLSANTVLSAKTQVLFSQTTLSTRRNDSLGSEWSADHDMDPSTWAALSHRDEMDEEIHRQLASYSAPTLKNPLVCIKAGDSITFSISNKRYPVYEKDSLLNTNPDFDYSAFRDLKTLATSSVRVTTFSYTFGKAGNYLFSMSDDATVNTMITVVSGNIECTTAAPFVEFTQSNLIKTGVTSNNKLVMSPDWNLVVGLIVGMLLLVNLVVGFLYYFRKKAWAAHHDIDQQYRRNNKKVTDPKATKGGMGMFKNNKVAVSPELGEDGNVQDDVEAAPALAGLDDAEFDDDMLIPDLAKHMQSHHDEIDRQLINQSDILNSLQQTLRKEVDDLKALLTATALDIQSAGAEQRNKRLVGILNQIKATAAARSVYEDCYDATEDRVILAFQHLRRLLTIGAENYADEIVTGIHTVISEAVARDEKVSDMQSQGLHDLFNEIGEITDIVQGALFKAISEEKRRVENAAAVYEKMATAAGVPIPDDILIKLNGSRDADIEHDGAIDASVNVIRVFTSRCPRFVEVMTTAESKFVHALSALLEKGNVAAAEQEEDSTRGVMTGYIKELFEAIEIVMQKSMSHDEHKGEVKALAAQARMELIAAIDAMLGTLGTPDTDLQQLIGPLLEALKAGNLGQMLTAGQKSSDEEGLSGGGDEAILATIEEESKEAMEGDRDRDGDAEAEAKDDDRLHDEQELADSMAAEAKEDTAGELPVDEDDEVAIVEVTSSVPDATAESETTEMDHTVLESVINNDGLSNSQKEEIIDSAQADLRLMDAMVEIERKKQEEAMKNALNARTDAKEADEADDPEAIAAKYKVEQAELEKKLEEEREKKLKAMMRTDDMEPLDMSSVHDSRVAALAANRYTAMMRCMGVETRLKYAMLHAESDARRLEKQQQSMTAANVSGKDLDNLVSDSYAEEGATLNALSSQIAADCEAAESAEDLVREKWMSNVNDVDVESEMERLRSDCRDRFVAARAIESALSALVQKNAHTSNMIKTHQAKLKAAKCDENVAKEVMKGAQDEIDEGAAMMEKDLLEELRVLDVEERNLVYILDRADSWGPKIDRRNQQNHLGARTVVGIYNESDIALRIALAEHELRAEIGQMRATCELTSHSADDAAVEIMMQNLQEAAHENGAILSKNIKNALNKSVQAEQARQKDAPVNYEKERFVSICRNAARNVSTALTLSRSRRTLLDEVCSALQDKQKSLLELLERQAMAEETKQLSIKQIEAETVSE